MLDVDVEDTRRDWCHVIIDKIDLILTVSIEFQIHNKIKDSKNKTDR